MGPNLAYLDNIFFFVSKQGTKLFFKQTEIMLLVICFVKICHQYMGGQFDSCGATIKFMQYEKAMVESL